jgi:uncharacterized protein
MMWDALILATGLMLILEGIGPFIAPKGWRELFRKLVELNDGQLRFIGLSSIVVGSLIVLLFR